jgi:sugar transferase (PEP-CTERM/EpsH1 system associated)
MTAEDPRPLIAHVVFRFDTGGLENGVVNLINHMPVDAYRHAVVAVTDVNRQFSRRIQREDVACHALHKPPGHGARVFPAMWRLMRRLKPALVHTRNLAALEMMLPAWAAGVPARVHGEHGRDLEDVDGTRWRPRWQRRAYRPLVHRYVALSRDLATYLEQRVQVPPGLVAQIYNGVDSHRFMPPPSGTRERIDGCPFDDPKLWLVGTVGRMQEVKDQTLLARAFIRALHARPALRERVRLVMVGSGPLKAQAERLLAQAGLADSAWLPGERSDVPEVMRGLDCFVLPSLAEGISNTILEAMATALPVIATDVGGNTDLVSHGLTGEIVPPADEMLLTEALVRMAENPLGAVEMGRAGRLVVERRFSMQAMVGAYQALYEAVLRQQAGHTRTS